MSKLSVTSFTNRTGSPFQKGPNIENVTVVHNDVLQNTFNKQKEKQNELLQKVTKKTAEYQANKPSSGVFTEVVSHGAFTVKNGNNNSEVTAKSNGTNSAKLLGFPSSANDLALDAKTDLESDPNISKEVKNKVIEKLFKLASMVQHMYESKVRIMTEFEKFKDTHLKTEIRREKEHSEQLYKINMNFQNEVVQAIQRLKSELDITRNVADDVIERNQRHISNDNLNSKSDSVDFNNACYSSNHRNSNDVIEEIEEPTTSL